MGSCLFAQAPQQTLAAARAALDAGEADKALNQIHSLPQAGANLAEAQNLECRVRFTLQQWELAVRTCEQAVRLDGQNWLYHMWLGRALGEKAGRASFFSAYSLGKRVRQEFEEAARLNPRSVDALSDLGQFYIAAPRFMGGGQEKADSVAVQLDKLDPARAGQLRGFIAEARKDYGTAEREYRHAIAVSSHPAIDWVDLAAFFGRRQRWSEMEAAVHSCANAATRDSRATVAFYDGAGLLIRYNRNPELAAKMLEEYLSSSSKTEEAPAFDAYLRLARLREKLGDAAAAKRDREEAAELASQYQPAHEERQN